MAAVFEIALPVRDHAGRRAREFDELADLGVAVRRQRRDRNRADLLQREIQDHELGDVGSCTTTRSSGFKPSVQQVQREIGREPVDLGVGDTSGRRR